MMRQQLKVSSNSKRAARRHDNSPFIIIIIIAHTHTRKSIFISQNLFFFFNQI